MIKCPHCGNSDIRVLHSTIVTERKFRFIQDCYCDSCKPKQFFQFENGILKTPKDELDSFVRDRTHQCYKKNKVY